MTVDELEQRMTVRELAQWDEWYALEQEAVDKAKKQAGQPTTQRGR